VECRWCYALFVRSSLLSMELWPLTSHFPSSKTLQTASAITAVNVLVAAGFSIVGMISPASILPSQYIPSKASSIFAMYAAARTLPLAAMTLIAIFKRSGSMLLVLGTLAGTVQILDCMVGIAQHDLGKIFGPLILGILQFYAVVRLGITSKTKRANGTVSECR